MAFMSAKQIVGSTIEWIIKTVVLVAIILFVYRTAVTAYDYGYRVFAEEPVSQGEGRTLSVYVEENASVREIGDMLQEKGLIRDGKLFWIQELLSENHGKIQPGIYDLNTSMTSQEMLAVMCALSAGEVMDEENGVTGEPMQESEGVEESTAEQESAAAEEGQEAGE